MMGEKWGMANGEWGSRPERSSCAPLPPSALRLPPSRHAFTLIELLITITIISIISAAILGTAASALEAGRRSKTQSMITRINGLLLERWDSYAERRYDIAQALLTAIKTNPNLTEVKRGQMLADVRLIAVRELMSMELPERWADVINEDLTISPSITNSPSILRDVPGIARVYRQRLNAIVGATNSVTNAANTVDDLLSNQQAECLYMIIMFHTGDGEARTFFTESDFGDTDGDGAPEFLDGWGNPIGWLRWPAGFVEQSSLMTGDADVDADPFDPYRRDSLTAIRPAPANYPNALVKDLVERFSNVGSYANRGSAYRLVPLICSMGPSGNPEGDPTWKPGITIGKQGYLAEPSSLDPYDPIDDETRIGTPVRDPDATDPDAWKDNLTNHLIEY